MGNFTHKLHSKRGVSVLLALLVMLLCAFAGTAAITMASANAGRHSYATLDSQAYYSATSAAKLVRDLLDGGTFVSDEITFSSITTVVDGDETTKTVSGSIDYDALGFKATLTSEFAGTGVTDAILYACNRLVPYRNIPASWYEISGSTMPSAPEPYEHKFTISSKTMNIGVIDATLIIYDNYDLGFGFYYDAGSYGTYAVSLYMRATVTEEPVTTTDEVLSADKTTLTRTETTKKRVTVSWSKDKSEISRGELEMSIAEEGHNA